jgi:S-adenosylmethionine:tRNA ribosyltransferase-isomerase
MSARLAFALPAALEAAVPPEARGVPRDGVRLMVTHASSGELLHTTFDRLPDHLAPGDLLVVNASATIPTALDAHDGGAAVVLHLSTRLDDGRWVVEPRHRTPAGSSRWAGPPPAPVLALGERATATLGAPYLGSTRLFVAELDLPLPTLQWLEVHGRPIRYDYVPREWPLAAYQTVYATEPGSAEMPSAGRPFSEDVLRRAVDRGVGVSPVVLHTGVASLEADEVPYPERASVPAWTAARVNETKAAGGRVVAVGTTVVRAVETAATVDGTVEPFEGWTDLVAGPDRPTRVVDAMVTGWHEPETSHLQLLEAVAGREALERSYAASLEHRYLFHEFGDSHLLLP